MRYMLLLPGVLLSLAGCVHADTSPAPARTSTTVVTPAPAAALVAPPASTTTVVRTP